MLKILILTFKPNEGTSLATALSKRGYKADTFSVVAHQENPLVKLIRVIFYFLRFSKLKYNLIVVDSEIYEGFLALFLSRLMGVPFVLYLKGFFCGTNER